MIVEIYDALLDAGAADDKARRAAEAMAGHEDRFHTLETKIDRLDTKIDRVEAGLNQRIDRVETSLTYKAQEIGHKIDGVETRLRGEQVLIRWLFGTLIAFVSAIGVKLFFP